MRGGYQKGRRVPGRKDRRTDVNDDVQANREGTKERKKEGNGRALKERQMKKKKDKKKIILT